MIIEIKDLPQGRKVKHINVDITFEEDGPVVKTELLESTEDTKVDHVPVQATDDIDFGDVPVPPTPVMEREHKEIPPEMQDLEF